jgi:hypothetical protein
MKSLQITGLTALLFIIAIMSLSHSNVDAARCQVRPPSYSLPSQAQPNQQVQSATTVDGSCGSNGEDYYSVRVDLIDVNSGLILSDNSTPIGYNATYFNVTVENRVTTPSTNGTWYLDIDVYVIRAGGTGGSYLLDYRNSTNATIQIGGTTPVPEFPVAFGLTVATSLSCAAVIMRKRRE